MEREGQAHYSKDPCLFRVGTWLHHPQQLTNTNGAYVNGEEEAFYEKGSIVDAHTQQLAKRVVDQDGQPILGGSSQDKVCASMLLNNTFFSIDEMNIKEVKRHYYPYVYAASEKFNDPKERKKGFKPQSRFLHKICNPNLIDRDSTERKIKYKKAVVQYIETAEEEGNTGTIQKFFHLWKGEPYKELVGDFDRRSENLSRFGILAVKNYQQLSFRSKGELEREETNCGVYFAESGRITYHSGE